MAYETEITVPCTKTVFSRISRAICTLKDEAYEHVVVEIENDGNDGNTDFIQTARAGDVWRVEISVICDNESNNILRYTIAETADKAVEIFRMVCIEGILPDMSNWEVVNTFPRDKTAPFRNVYHHFCMIPISEKDKNEILFTLPDIDKSDAVLAYGFINEWAELRFLILAGCDKNSHEFFDTYTGEIITMQYDYTDGQMYTYEGDDSEYREKYADRIAEAEAQENDDEELIEVRNDKTLDEYRCTDAPDMVNVLFEDELDDERHFNPVMAEYIDEDGDYVGVLTEEPEVPCGYHAYDMVYFFLDDNGVPAAYDHVTWTAEDLEDGELMRDALDEYDRHFSIAAVDKVLELLRKSKVNIPVNLTEDSEGIMTPYFGTLDDKKYLPVFTHDHLQDADRYDHDCHVLEKTGREVVRMIKNIAVAENIDGIIINPGSDSFLINGGMFEYVLREDD